MFITPAHVLGKDHPLSITAEQVALMGDAAAFSASDQQCRVDWLETAQSLGLPLRSVFYIDQEANWAVQFNLFLPDEANRVPFKDSLVPMTEKYRRIYDDLVAIKYIVSNNPQAPPLPAERVMIEIVGQHYGGDSDGDHPITRHPVTDGRRARKRRPRLTRIESARLRSAQLLCFLTDRDS